MESNKLEKPRKNGTFSTLRGVMNPHEEDRGVFLSMKSPPAAYELRRLLIQAPMGRSFCSVLEISQSNRAA